MWSSWTIRWATLNGWWYGRLTTPVPSLIVWLTWATAASSISGEAIVSQPDEWCSPTQNSSKPRRSRWAPSATSRWNISVGDSPVGWCGARNAPKRILVIAGSYATGLEPIASLASAVETKGLEPSTPALQRRCATNCATSPGPDTIPAPVAPAPPCERPTGRPGAGFSRP